MMQSFNPATDTVLGEFPICDAGTIENRLRTAAGSQKAWARLGVRQRTPYLLQVTSWTSSSREGSSPSSSSTAATH